MLYANKIQDINIPLLHDAAMTLSLRGFRFRSLHMDSRGECTISYYGWLTQQQIKEVMINFCYPN